jgi:hypothetical protein
MRSIYESTVPGAGCFSVVRLHGTQLQLVRDPHDGRVLAFADRDEAFVFAVSLELEGDHSAGTVVTPDDAALHLVRSAAEALDLMRRLEEAA